MKEYDQILGLGKVSPEIMKRSVFPLLPLAHASELDGGKLQPKGDLVIAHSPSIGVPLKPLGFFAFHYAAANVAAKFAVPRHLIVGIYLPLQSTERDLRTIVGALGVELHKYGATVAAGQTATYAGIEIPLLTATCMGEQIRTPRKPYEGDIVCAIGEVGGEALWLKSLSERVDGDVWRDFTPLPAILSLQEAEPVVLMHDVSEGGVKRALYEVAADLNMRLNVESDRFRLVRGVEGLGEDPLRLPTYGSLMVLVGCDGVSEVEEICDKMETPFSVVGEVSDGAGLYLDGVEVEIMERIVADDLYGSFKGFS